MKLTIVANSEIAEHDVSPEEMEYFLAEQRMEDNGESFLSESALRLLENTAQSEIRRHQTQKVLMWLAILIILIAIAEVITG